MDRSWNSQKCSKKYTTFAGCLPACRPLGYSFSLEALLESKESESSSSWDELQTELASLNQRLFMWQQQVRDELRKLIDPIKAASGGFTHEEQHDALRRAMAKAGDGPRREINHAIDQLCLLYLDSDGTRREDIRSFLGAQSHILHDLWGYIHRAAVKLREEGSEQWLRFGAAVASMEDLRTDHHDTLDGLGDLYLAATEAGFNPGRIFKEVSELCSDREPSIRQVLRNFEGTPYFSQEIQPQLARQSSR